MLSHAFAAEAVALGFFALLGALGVGAPFRLVNFGAIYNFTDHLTSLSIASMIMELSRARTFRLLPWALYLWAWILVENLMKTGALSVTPHAAILRASGIFMVCVCRTEMFDLGKDLQSM